MDLVFRTPLLQHLPHAFQLAECGRPTAQSDAHLTCRLCPSSANLGQPAPAPIKSESVVIGVLVRVIG